MRTRLKENEKVALIIRPHVITLVPSGLISAGIIAAGILVIYAGWVAGGLAFPVIAVLYFLYRMAERKNNLWAVTNFRVIDEDGVFSRNSKESPIDKINNVSYTQSLWGRMLGFGDVQIQTAAEMGSTTYYTVESPKLLKDTITLMQEEFRNYQMTRQAAENANAINAGKTTDVAAELEKLHQLMVKGIITEQEFRQRKEQLLRS
ncbi:MAG: PH domain-containing protein [Bacteroidetes bacterium]|nr:PH domain-containing protein [Bacteroidota bacterium]